MKSSGTAQSYTLLDADLFAKQQLLEVELVEVAAELHLVALHVDTALHTLAQTHQLHVGLQSLQAGQGRVLLVHVVLEVLLDLQDVELDPLGEMRVAEKSEIAPHMRALRDPSQDTQERLKLSNRASQLVGEA